MSEQDVRQQVLTISPEDMAQAIVKISTESGRQAGTALEAFAHVRGDLETTEVIKNTDPIVLGKIVSAYDYTNPSIASWLMTPEILKEIIETHPIHWEKVVKDDPELASQSALEFFTYILGSENQPLRIQQILDVVYGSDSGMMYLYLALFGFKVKTKQQAYQYEYEHDEESDYFALHENHQEDDHLESYQVGSKGYLHKLIEEYHSELALAINNMLSGLHEFKIPQWNDLFELTQSVLNNAHRKLEQKIVGLSEEESLDDFFEPLD